MLSRFSTIEKEEERKRKRKEGKCREKRTRKVFVLALEFNVCVTWSVPKFSQTILKIPTTMPFQFQKFQNFCTIFRKFKKPLSEQPPHIYIKY